MRGNKNPFVSFIKDLSEEGLEGMGKFYSSYRAFVANREDPLRLGRVQLIIPEITGNQVFPIWAFPKGNFAGPGYGVQCIPQQKDLVWVEFEHGNPNVPIWSHGYRGNGEVPQDEEAKDYNNHWFITPGGHKIYLNDTSQSIKIERAGGDIIEMNSESVSIITNKKIIHGARDNAKYSHVLGEELKSTLDDLIEAVNKIGSALQLDVTASASSTFLMKVNLAAQMPTAITKIKSAISKVQKILSTQVKLEK